ncbi:hypothetical protein QWY86_16215 [Pedobacter aquatilis]|uniref:hypothetical protein n=1 Tax=Pedobacter aquatilis TaxID=351343 RepID=UPI0025B30E92|nr:hypothetical protein [Pedobacter aquatilis]MDN3588230.1 hypothetical protein [Pedobacter aquatilis]
MKNSILFVIDYLPNVELIDLLLEVGFEVTLLYNVSKFRETVSWINPSLIIMNMEFSLSNNGVMLKIPWPDLALADIPIIIMSDLSKSKFLNLPQNVDASIINPLDFDLVRNRALEIIN